MYFIKKYGKIILFDTLAVLCFAGVIAFGWLPGPGGLPLFLLGLSLLAVNHEWAERWLETAKHKGSTIKDTLFPNKTWVRNLYDIGTVFLFGTGMYLLLNASNRFIEGASVLLMTASLFVFLLNRDRFDYLTSLFTRK
ncbi:MAG: hypothetical protein M3Q14_03015 [bacterium]|nr:hypothetical protein [bacterium]